MGINFLSNQKVFQEVSNIGDHGPLWRDLKAGKEGKSKTRRNIVEVKDRWSERHEARVQAHERYQKADAFWDQKKQLEQHKDQWHN